MDWLSSRDASADGAFVWVTGDWTSLPKSPWAIGQPGTAMSACATQVPSLWTTVDSHETHPFLCEKDVPFFQFEDPQDRHGHAYRVLYDKMSWLDARKVARACAGIW